MLSSMDLTIYLIMRFIILASKLTCYATATVLIGNVEDNKTLSITGDQPIPKCLKHTNTLDVFTAFYVNKYTDHHAHKIAF